MAIGEIIFVVLLVGGMIIPGVIIGRKTGHWHLLGVFITFFLCFGLWEWHAVATTGLSISQQVWEFADANPKLFWTLMGMLIIGWLSLIWHFGVKRIFGRK